MPSAIAEATRATRRLGHWAAALALFCQLVLGAVVVDMAAAHARLAAAGLCTATNHPAPRKAPPHPADCALCPAAAALHAAVALPAPPAALPPPSAHGPAEARRPAAPPPAPWPVSAANARAPPPIV